MMEYPIHSLAVGKPKIAAFGTGQVSTAIHKQVINESLYLSETQLDGDEQADKKNHGGKDKAVCAYCFERYTYWEPLFGRRLEKNQFGENLSIKDLIEEKAYIGDIFRFGEAILQISQPRIPCFKLGIRSGKEDIVKLFQETGYTGFYFRVLQPGYVSVNAPLELVSHESNSKSIMQLNRLFFNSKTEADEIEKALLLPALSEVYKDSLRSKISKRDRK